MFETLDPKTRKRVERRYEELKIDPEAFIRRFDLNNDGELDANEKQAALATLAHELLREESLSVSVDGTELVPGVTILERYQILSKIGNGAQGIAYAARDLEDQQIIVVKQLRISHMNAWDAYDAFRREADVLARLTHPNLPRFIDAFQIEENSKYFYFSVQSLMPGKNLADRIESGEFFSEADLVSIATQCLDILHYLHNYRPAVLHRDLKPSNLLLDDSGKVYLVDFGAVQYVTDSKTMAVGTAGYMASEQLYGAAQPQSDLYSLGATLVRLATRLHPHELELKQMRMVWRDYASLSNGFSNWIDKLIDPEMEDRFQNAQSAKSFLEDTGRVLVRREMEKDPSLSLNLVEQFTKKPDYTKVRIWESVDQFVCTFSESKTKRMDILGAFSDIMHTLFETKHYESLTRRGGGFSFDSNAKCRVNASSRSVLDTELMNRKLNEVQSIIFKEGDSGLLGIHNNGRHETQVALIVGLDSYELEWVRGRLSAFLSSHHLELM